jgi:hypothetical protein
MDEYGHEQVKIRKKRRWNNREIWLKINM